jgi:hypothetical protein
MNIRKQKECNNKGYYSSKGRESKNTYEGRYRPSNQNRSCDMKSEMARCDMKSEMARLKQMQRKRNPLGKEVLNSSRWLTRMEWVMKDVEDTFHTLVTPKGKATIT